MEEIEIEKTENRLGLIKNNKFGSLMEVVKYENYHEVLVKFSDGNVIKCKWSQFKKGSLRNPYDRTLYGIGYIGEGVYKSRRGNDKKTAQYQRWKFMLQRCYDEDYIEKYPTYKGCSVSDDWHSLQNFAKWYDENLYEVEGQRVELDKDILVKGNKVYSPDTCIFVPQNINYLFTKRQSKRGELPIGVHWDKRIKKYRAQCSDGHGGKINIGSFDDPIEAFRAYKIAKEKLIKEVAAEYKDKIPVRLYNALMNYEVEITD